MKVGRSPEVFARVVERLRAAGCVFAEEEAELLLAAADGDAAVLTALVDRRTAGEPLEHVVGWAEFCGLRIAVGPGAFVPRRRSEFLVAEAVRLAAGAGPAPVVVDLCCGTGAIAAAVLHSLKARAVDPVVHAADVDPGQTAWARRNLPPGVGVHDGDLFDALPGRLRGRIDVLVANAPYVPTGHLAALPAEARDHEPVTALDGGVDGVELHRRIGAAAARWLARHGSVLVETSERQSPLTVAALRDGGLAARVVRCEELEATVVVGTPRPA